MKSKNSYRFGYKATIVISLSLHIAFVFVVSVRTLHWMIFFNEFNWNNLFNLFIVTSKLLDGWGSIYLESPILLSAYLTSILIKNRIDLLWYFLMD